MLGPVKSCSAAWGTGQLSTPSWSTSCLVQSCPWEAEWLMCLFLLLQGGHLASASSPCFGAVVLSFWRDAWGISALEKPCLQPPAVGTGCPSSQEAPCSGHQVPIIWRSPHPLERHLEVGTRCTSSGEAPCHGHRLPILWRSPHPLEKLYPLEKPPAVGTRCSSSGKAPILWRSSLQ